MFREDSFTTLFSFDVYLIANTQRNMFLIGKVSLLVFLVILATECETWRRRRRRRFVPPPRPRHCVVSGWSAWSACSQPCGNNGLQSRTRTVKIPPANGGRRCPALSEQRACNRFCHNGGSPQASRCSCRPGFSGTCCQSVDGKWSSWGEWGECSKTCGGGNAKRMRTCTSPAPSNGGRHCVGTREQSRLCENSPCPVKLKSVGCFADKSASRSFSHLVANLREEIDWYNLNKTVAKCAELVHDRGWEYFSLQFFGECWSGENGRLTYDRNGQSNNCVLGVGKESANFVYRLV